MKIIDEHTRNTILDNITFYANQTLRTIALCYRDLDRWPPGNTFGAEEVPYDKLAHELTLIGITSIEDPLCPGVWKLLQIVTELVYRSRCALVIMFLLPGQLCFSVVYLHLAV